METITPREYLKRTTGRRKRNKYGAKKTVIDGIKFDSRMEANYYLELKLMLNKKQIVSFKRQPHFELAPAGKTSWGQQYTKVVYTPDFLVEYPDGHVEAVEVKGRETEAFGVRKRLFYYLYPNIMLKIITYSTSYGWIELSELKKKRSLRRKLKKVET